MTILEPDALFAADLSDLFHSSDPDTSRQAAESQTTKLSPMREAVLGLFRSHPEGLTSSEVAHLYARDRAVYGWPEALPATPIKRKSDLAKAGMILVTDERRSNEHGLMESVWKLS